MGKWRPILKRRTDTRRKTWKQFGGHNAGKYIGGNKGGSGKYYKKKIHRAERQYYRMYAKRFLETMHNPDADEPNVTDRFWRHALTDENWAGW